MMFKATYSCTPTSVPHAAKLTSYLEMNAARLKSTTVQGKAQNRHDLGVELKRRPLARIRENRLLRPCIQYSGVGTRGGLSPPPTRRLGGLSPPMSRGNDSET